MGESPKDLKYTREHEWVRLEDGAAVVGITEYAQGQLGDLVYFELPEMGTELRQFEKLGEAESVKAVSDLFAPLSGEVIETNERVLESPEVVNSDPYGEGWLVKISVSDFSELEKLLTAEEYDSLLAAESSESEG